MICLKGNAIDRDTAQNGKWYQEDKSYTLDATDRHGVCAGFKLGNSEKARSIGYAEEQAPTLNAECGGNKPAVMAFDTTQITSKQNGSIPDFGKPCHTLNANAHVPCAVLDMNRQIPLTYQKTTGTLSPGAHAGSYNGQDAYNDMLIVSSEIHPALRAKANDPYRTDMAAYVASVDCRSFTEGGETNGTLQAKESGFPLIWEQLNGYGTCLWASEIEEFPMAVTRRRFGTAEVMGDMGRFLFPCGEREEL